MNVLKNVSDKVYSVLYTKKKCLKIDICEKYIYFTEINIYLNIYERNKILFLISLFYFFAIKEIYFIEMKYFTEIRYILQKCIFYHYNQIS